jgi:hypothetical protein
MRVVREHLRDLALQRGVVCRRGNRGGEPPEAILKPIEGTKLRLELRTEIVDTGRQNPIVIPVCSCHQCECVVEIIAAIFPSKAELSARHRAFVEAWRAGPDMPGLAHRGDFCRN